MKATKWLRLAILLVLVMVVGAGCAKKQVAQPSAEPAKSESQASASSGSDSGSSMSQAQDAEALKAKQLAEAVAKAKTAIAESKIFFDFDKFDLKPQARQVLKDISGLMKKYPDIRVLVEGHCDSRGTEEYNLALGERRARASYEFLVLLGVKASQLEIVSYGEERPLDPRSNEAAWAKNRRDEFKIIR